MPSQTPPRLAAQRQPHASPGVEIRDLAVCSVQLAARCDPSEGTTAEPSGRKSGRAIPASTSAVSALPKAGGRSLISRLSQTMPALPGGPRSPARRTKLDLDVVREIVCASREAQGLPPTITDPTVMARLATLVSAVSR